MQLVFKLHTLTSILHCFLLNAVGNARYTDMWCYMLECSFHSFHFAKAHLMATGAVGK